MNKHYLGKLQLEANVPDKSMLNEFINITLNFEIICPKCGPKKHKIKKNGHDYNVEGNPQFFKCKQCNSSFYPHTSWIFKEFTALVLENVMKCLFVDSLSVKSVANKFNVSQSLISKIRYQCFDLLKKKVEYYQTAFK